VPKDGTATRTRILDTAERLMIEQGYSATSVDQIIAESASSKGAFFHHFQSKSDLALQLTDRYVTGDLANLDAALAATAHIDDAAQRVLAFVRYFEDMGDEVMSAQSGCLYAMVLAEREFTGQEINEIVARATLQWRKAFGDLLRAALRARRRKLDVDDLADHLYVTFEGAFILCRTLQDPSKMRAQLRVLRQLLDALFE
jgi:TetR/AcrR family transcriptional repressor of nem operon